MSDLSTLKFFTTQSHPCSYLPEREATTLFLDPAVVPNQQLHSQLSHHGFRRSGDYLYRPHCVNCHACLPARVVISDFDPQRRFKRILKRNHDLSVSITPASTDAKFHQLYQRYICQRHRDGDMYPPNKQQFEHFLLSHWSHTRFLCFHQQDKLLAVAVVDRLDDGLSAVYSFFDPDSEARSLGIFAILTQIQQCQQLGLPYLYLGYLIRSCRKMAYKEDFGPLEVLTDQSWQRLTPVG